MSSLELDELPDDIGINDSSASAAGENPQESADDSVNVQQTDQEQREKLVQFPLVRVRNIMRTDPDVNSIPQEVIFLITKSTELFIDSLAKEAYKYTAQTKKKTLQKRDIESAIDNIDALVFLEGMLDQWSM